MEEEITYIEVPETLLEPFEEEESPTGFTYRAGIVFLDGVYWDDGRSEE